MYNRQTSYVSVCEGCRIYTHVVTTMIHIPIWACTNQMFFLLGTQAPPQLTFRQLLTFLSMLQTKEFRIYTVNKKANLIHQRQLTHRYQSTHCHSLPARNIRNCFSTQLPNKHSEQTELDSIKGIFKPGLILRIPFLSTIFGQGSVHVSALVCPHCHIHRTHTTRENNYEMRHGNFHMSKDTYENVVIPERHVFDF